MDLSVQRGLGANPWNGAALQGMPLRIWTALGRSDPRGGGNYNAGATQKSR